LANWPIDEHGEPEPIGHWFTRTCA